MSKAFTRKSVRHYVPLIADSKNGKGICYTAENGVSRDHRADAKCLDCGRIGEGVICRNCQKRYVCPSCGHRDDLPPMNEDGLSVCEKCGTRVVLSEWASINEQRDHINKIVLDEHRTRLTEIQNNKMSRELWAVVRRLDALMAIASDRGDSCLIENMAKARAILENAAIVEKDLEH